MILFDRGLNSLEIENRILARLREMDKSLEDARQRGVDQPGLSIYRVSISVEQVEPKL